MTISCPRSHGTLSLSLRASRRTKLIAAWGWDLVSSASGMLFGHVSSVPDREPWHENNSLDEVHFQVEDTLNGYLFRCPWWLVRQVPFVCIGWESAFGGGGKSNHRNWAPGFLCNHQQIPIYSSPKQYMADWRRDIVWVIHTTPSPQHPLASPPISSRQNKCKK